MDQKSLEARYLNEMVLIIKQKQQNIAGLGAIIDQMKKQGIDQMNTAEWIQEIVNDYKRSKELDVYLELIGQLSQIKLINESTKMQLASQVLEMHDFFNLYLLCLSLDEDNLLITVQKNKDQPVDNLKNRELVVYKFMEVFNEGQFTQEDFFQTIKISFNKILQIKQFKELCGSLSSF